MNRISRFVVAGFVCCMCVAAYGEADSGKPEDATVVTGQWPEDLPPLRLLVGGHRMGFIAVINDRGQEEWRIRDDGPANCWLIDDDTLLYATGYGIKEVRRDAAAAKGCRVVWEHKPTERVPIYAAQPLGSNIVLFAENRTARIDVVELDRRSGEERKRVVFEGPGLTTANHNSRRICKSSRGTYLFSSWNVGRYEVDGEGKLVTTFEKGFGGYCLEEKPGGGYLAGGKGGVSAYDSEGKLLWSLGRKDIPGVEINVITSVHQYPDGRLLLAHFSGRRPTEQPCLILLSADRKIVEWSLRFPGGYKIGTFQVLDADG